MSAEIYTTRGAKRDVHYQPAGYRRKSDGNRAWFCNRAYEEAQASARSDYKLPMPRTHTNIERVTCHRCKQEILKIVKEWLKPCNP